MDPSVATLIGIGAAGLAASVATGAVRKEFSRRRVIADRLWDFASPGRHKAAPQTGRESGFRINLRRVFWDDREDGYVNDKGKPIALIPLKTITLNFHWSVWMNRVDYTGTWFSDLDRGLRIHVNKEGAKLGAEAFYITEKSVAHGNPIYSVAFFKFQRARPSVSEPLLEDIIASSDASSTPSSRATTSP